MKLEKRKQDEVANFWVWFEDFAKKFPSANHLLPELDRRLRSIAPELSWEIGPGILERYQFTVSPNLDKDNLESAREVISAAPVVENWEFHYARPTPTQEMGLQLHA